VEFMSSFTNVDLTADQAWRVWSILEVAQSMGTVSARLAARWVDHLEQTIRTAQFFSACMGFGVVGSNGD
jgi:hypothetical protein